MAAEINWNRYGTNLRHCQPVYKTRPTAAHVVRSVSVCRLDTLMSQLMKYGRTDQDAFCIVNLGWPKEPCLSDVDRDPPR